MLEGKNSIVPPQDYPCVWVTAGVVGYKLCDRNFECESCAFYTTIRERRHKGIEDVEVISVKKAAPVHQAGAVSNANEFVDKFIDTIDVSAFPSDLFYSEGHIWMKEMDEGRFRVGTDHIAASLFSDVECVVTPQVPTHLGTNSHLVWIILWDGAVTQRIPVAGTIERTNSLLNESPRLIMTSPYESGWIADIKVQDSTDVLRQCKNAESISDISREQLHKLGNMIKEATKGNTVIAGKTMFDGGVQVTNLQELIGGKNYVRLLNLFLKSK
jgi:glycine cleavage system H protein